MERALTDAADNRPDGAADADIAVDIDEAVGVISFNRPLRRNSMDGGFVNGCRAALRDLGADPGIRSVVMHARETGFSAGSDLKFIAPMAPDDICRFEAECAALGRQIALMPVPVIAAVEGFAIGGGMTLATCCDLVVTGRSAKWALPEVPIGWLTPWGIWSLQARVGSVRARSLCYCLAPITGAQACEMGLADMVVEDGAAFAAAMDRAERLAALPTAAISGAKAVFARRILSDAESGDSRSNRAFARDLAGETAHATLKSFVS